MLGCFATSQTDGTEESFRMTLRALLATTDSPIPGPCIAKKLIERKLGLGTRKTLQARTNLLDTACHSLARAKQRSGVSPSYYIKSELRLFPLPLPPGHKPTSKTSSANAASKSIPVPPKRRLPAASACNAAKSGGPDCARQPSSNHTDIKRSEDSSVDSTVMSSTTTSTFSMGHTSSSANATCYTCMLLSDETTASPTSPTSSSSLFSTATPSSLSQSSSFNSASTTNRDLRCSSFSLRADECHSFIDEDLSGSFFIPCTSHAVSSPALREFSSRDIASSLDDASLSEKLTDGAMGSFYKSFLPQEGRGFAISRVKTRLSRRKWSSRVHALAQLDNCSVNKVVGWSYAEGRNVKGMAGNACDNVGFIVYENIGDESLHDFLQDVEKGIDWIARLKLAINITEALIFAIKNMPNNIDLGKPTLQNIRVDSSLNAKIFDFLFLSAPLENPKERSLCNVVESLALVLLQVFNLRYPQSGASLGWVHNIYPHNDAKLIGDLLTSCLHREEASRPSIMHVAHVLHSVEPTKYLPQYPIKQSKSFTYRKKRSLSFG